MTGFSAQWLTLREPADHRARDQALQQRLCVQLTALARTEQRVIRLIDLGCGSGSNLRALAAALPFAQHWTLVDYDPLLLAAARATLPKSPSLTKPPRPPLPTAIAAAALAAAAVAA